MVDAGEGCIGWGARDRDLMRGTVWLVSTKRRTERKWGARIARGRRLRGVISIK